MSESVFRNKRKQFRVMFFTVLAFCAIPVVIGMIPRENWIAWRLQSKGYKIEYRSFEHGIWLYPTKIRCGRETTKEDLQLIFQMSNLRYITFSHVDFSDVDLQPLAELPILIAITFSDCSHLRPEELQKLGAASELILITISMGRFFHPKTESTAIHITPETLENWNQCSLRTLSLIDCELTDACLEPIAKCSQIGFLHLSDNPGITDAGLEHLLKLEHLEELFLSNASITKEGVEEFQKKHPNKKLRVIWYGKTFVR